MALGLRPSSGVLMKPMVRGSQRKSVMIRCEMPAGWQSSLGVVALGTQAKAGGANELEG